MVRGTDVVHVPMDSVPHAPRKRVREGQIVRSVFQISDEPVRGLSTTLSAI